MILESMLRDLSGLIKIPSVKAPPSPHAPYGVSVVAALDYMLDLGRSMGFQTSNLDGHAGYIEYGSKDPLFAILCHLDVVPADKGWSSDPFLPQIKEDRLIGRGAIDDKGPAIAVLYAMKSLLDEGYDPGCRIRLILGLDEESGAGCMQHYRAVEKIPDLGFTPDSKFPVIYAEKGILHLTLRGIFPSQQTPRGLRLISIRGGERANMIPGECTYTYIDGVADTSYKETSTVLGKPGHASLPELGENAISKAVMELAGLFDSQNTRHPFLKFYSDCIQTQTDGAGLGIACSDDETGALTCNVGLVNCDESEVSITLDIRYPKTISQSTILRLIRKKIKPFGMKIDTYSGVKPLYVSPESEYIQILLNVCNERTGRNDQPVFIGGGSYARYMPNVVAYGPVFRPQQDVAHQADEYILKSDLEDCLCIYREAIRRSCEYLIKKNKLSQTSR